MRDTCQILYSTVCGGKKQNMSSGYTLIEILVVTVIVSLLSGIGLAGYGRFNQSQTLRQSGELIKTTMRDVQNRALSGQKDCSVCQGADLECNNGDDLSLDYWQADIVVGTSDYSISGFCGGLEFMRQESHISPDLTFQAGSASVVQFDSNGREMSGFDKEVVLEHNGSGDVLTVTVSASGQVY